MTHSSPSIVDLTDTSERRRRSFVFDKRLSRIEDLRDENDLRENDENVARLIPSVSSSLSANQTFKNSSKCIVAIYDVIQSTLG